MNQQEILSELSTAFNSTTAKWSDLAAYYERVYGTPVPVFIRETRRISRGIYSIDPATAVVTEVPAVQAAPKAVRQPRQPKAAPIAVQAATVVDMTEARQVKLDAGENFDRAGLTPMLDQNFVPYGQYKKLEKLMKVQRFLPVYVTGPTGVGKSSMLKHIAAKQGKMFARVTITSDTTDDDLFGRKSLKDGNLVFEDGIMTVAAELGFPIVLDEISAGDPRKLFGLYTILEGDRHFIKDANKFVNPKPGFNIFCTDNTYGRGDETGSYLGTNILNEAMLDRFAMTVEQSYPTENEQFEIIQLRMQTNGLPLNKKNVQVAKNIAKWATINRKAYQEQAIEDVISVRRTLAIVDIYSVFGNEIDAVSDACTRFGPETREAMIQHYRIASVETKEEVVPTAVEETEESDLFQ